MESLSLCISSSFKPYKTTQKSLPNPLHIPLLLPNNFKTNKVSTFLNSLTSKPSLKPHLSLPILINFISPFSSFATEFADPSSQTSEKINLEAILTSIDDFFNKYPFFVAGCTFIWLIVLPLVEEFSKKYKVISPLNAFKKLRDDSSVQLLDIRDGKSLEFLGSPNLRMLNKDVVQVAFDEGDKDGFLKKVMEKFANPNDTCVCIVDSSDGNSIQVAELLVKNGFKEVYAIKGGLSGKSGWREIQEEFLPPSVHVYPKKKKGGKSQKKPESNGAANQPDNDQVQAAITEK